MKKLASLVAIGGVFMLSSCSVNLLPKHVKHNPNSEKLEIKGKSILHKAYLAHGVENLLKHQVYHFKANDTWQGMMGSMGKLWPQKSTDLSIKYAVNTFDAQLTFMSGKTSGNVVGLQSWNYYSVDKESGKANFDVKNNKRFTFGMAAFQYFTEIVGRMNKAEIIRYAGEENFNGVDYDLVYVTWKQEDASDDFDQYVLYINKSNSMLEYASYTIRDNYMNMPGASMFYGSIHFTEFTDIAGYKVPFTQSIFINKPQEDDNKYVHQLKLSSFTFDSFDKKELYPNSNLSSVGDSKEGK